MRKNVMRFLAIVAVGALCLAYGRYSAITSAELVEDNGETYIISFDGEEHMYRR